MSYSSGCGDGYACPSEFYCCPDSNLPNGGTCWSMSNTFQCCVDSDCLNGGTCSNAICSNGNINNNNNYQNNYTQTIIFKYSYTWYFYNIINYFKNLLL